MKYLKKYKEDKNIKSNIKDIILLAKSILATKNINDKYKKELLSVLVWKMTEINGKNNTRFISEGVYKGKTPIEHEHVIPRKIIVEQIIKSPSKVDKILKSATACLVTKEEHNRLKNLGDGWNRYKIAKIKVYDQLNKCWF